MKPEAPTIYRFGAFQFDPHEQVLLKNDEIVPIETKTAQVLHMLLQKPGRVVEKQEISAEIWPETFVEERNIAQHVYTLRKVLREGKGGQRCIETVQRRGYRFVAPVSVV